jgi:predicted  nucleic acid-binding Zn-ribbon protein
MRSNGNYIKLPTLRSISVNNYALFRDSWTHKVKNGLNIFLGANGFGKTTTVNLIIYGIVGVWKEYAIESDGKERIVDELSEEYFSDREHEGLRKQYNNATPTVVVEFDVESIKIKVERSLTPLQIISFYVDGKKVAPDKSLALEETYQNRILALCSLGSINDLSFILRKLIMREEEGNYLLWNRDDQSKIIRLLFNPPGFFRSFNEIQKETTKANSAVNRQTDFKSQFVTRRNLLVDEKEKAILRVSGDLDPFQLKKKYDEQKNVESSLQEDNDKLLDDIAYLSNELKAVEEKANGLSSDLESMRERINTLEDKYFTAIYYDPRIRLIYNKVEQRKSCIFCNNPIGDEKAQQIVGAVKHNHCPVCNNAIRQHDDVDATPPKDVLNQLQLLRDEAIEKDVEFTKTLDVRKSIESELTQRWSEQKEIQKNILSVKQELSDMKLALEKSKNDGEPNPLDIAIQKYSEEIDKYQITIDDAREKFLANKKLLDEFNAQLNSRIEELISGLSEGFSKYAEKFYFKDLNLTTYEGRQKSDSKLKLTSFCPVLEGKERLTDKSVSKSEGILLEYVFRMALIRHYYALTKIHPFLILESSEGSFDIVRTEQLAEIFTLFGKNDFPFISITNLSKPQFVKIMLKGIKNARDRIFNFIDVGAHDELLDKQQKLEKTRYAAELKKLGL